MGVCFLSGMTGSYGRGTTSYRKVSWTTGRLELAFKAGFEPASPAYQAKYP
jgi:hypothetical protein